MVLTTVWVQGSQTVRQVEITRQALMQKAGHHSASMVVVHTGLGFQAPSALERVLCAFHQQDRCTGSRLVEWMNTSSAATYTVRSSDHAVLRAARLEAAERVLFNVNTKCLPPSSRMD